MSEFLQKLLGRRRHRRIFISYRRRGDGAGYGGRLADSLVEHFGHDQCFLDVEHIAPGVDFVKTIEQGIGACEVLVVVIGPDWVTQTDGAGRPRLQDPGDWVRIEVAAALKRDVRVIPVLVGGAVVPAEEDLPEDLKSLSRRQVHELSDSRWGYDVRTLVQAIERAGIRGRASAEQVALRQRVRAVAAAVLAGGLVLSTALVANHFRVRQQGEDIPIQPKSGPVTKIVQEDEEKYRISRQLAESERAREEAVRTAQREQWERQEAERRLVNAQKEREESLRTADRARSEKREADQRVIQARLEKEKADREREEALKRSVPVSLTSSRPIETQTSAAVLPCGTAQVVWQHQGVLYEANLLMNGSQGAAAVSFPGPLGIQSVEQDIHIVASADFLSYAGSNPRIAGTNVRDFTYLPDTFRMERLSNAKWRIRDVGYPGHFDLAQPGPRSAATSLADCR